MGFANTLSYVWKSKVLNRLYSLKKEQSFYRQSNLRSRELLHPVCFRYNSSDIPVFHTIFVKNEYETIEPDKPPKLIVDCGANVGYSSAYFLSKYPSARVIAVEPDKRNYEVLRQNLKPYGDRATTILSAVWSHKAKLKVVAGEFADNREWATTVKECAENEAADLEALDISSILAQSGCDEIDILKIDIEGSEAIVFEQNYKPWLDKAGIIAIELHGKKCREIFHRALGLDDFDFSRAGELTIARRTKAKV